MCARSSRVSTVFHHLLLQCIVKSFLVKNTKIKNTKFPYKTFPSIANVKINSMGSTKWTYHRDRSFASNYFIFWKFCFSLGTPFKELIWRTNYPNIHIQTFCICWSFIWRCFFTKSYLDDMVICVISTFFNLVFILVNKTLNIMNSSDRIYKRSYCDKRKLRRNQFG